MTCPVAGCDRDVYCKGYCEPHYRRFRKFGDPRPDVPIGDLQKKKRPVRACEVCGALFVQGRHQNGRYCSRRCASSIPESVARLIAGSRATAQRRGDAQRGRGEGKTYRKWYGRHEHRVVAEQKIGRSLQPGEIVHHIDGNHLNNDPANLAVITQSEHIRIHKPRKGQRKAA